MQNLMEHNQDCKKTTIISLPTEGTVMAAATTTRVTTYIHFARDGTDPTQHSANESQRCRQYFEYTDARAVCIAIQRGDKGVPPSVCSYAGGRRRSWRVRRRLFRWWRGGAWRGTGRSQPHIDKRVHKRLKRSRTNKAIAMFAFIVRVLYIGH